MKSIRQRFSVSFEYAVSFTHGVFGVENTLLAETVGGEGSEAARVLVVVDGGLADATPGLVEQIGDYFRTHNRQLKMVCPVLVVPGGEGVKNSWESVDRIIEAAGCFHLDRHSYMLVVGGGSVLDMAGFAAALIHRGVRLIRLPSTVLAQNDAGVGVKNSMNAAGAKNFLGSFAPPYAVINDLEFLQSLPEREWRGGIAEAFKVAIIKDRQFFDYLCANAVRLQEREQGVMERLVYRTAEMHLEHISTSGDPFEMGSARPLDFGHWAAHQLELMSGFELGHGYAVSIGIALDTTYAMLQGLITAEECEAVVCGLEQSGLPVWSELLERRGSGGGYDVMEGLELFREHLGGELCVTLPAPLGARVEVRSINEELMIRALEVLGERQRRGESVG